MPPDPQPARLQQLYRAALDALERGHADAAREPIAELARALPGDRGVAALARRAAVVGFTCAGERVAATLSARTLPRPEDVELVAFHVDLPAPPSGMHQPIDYMAILSRAFESARIRAPRARRILLTDESTAVPDSLGADEVRRFTVDRGHIMFERMRLQELHVSARAAQTCSVLMDADVVVNRDPTGIFGEDFDIGLTWRAGMPEAPFNGGMIFVGPGAAGGRFLAKALACYEALDAQASVRSFFPKTLKAWGGDQFALAAAVGYREFGTRAGEAMSVDGVRVRFFPAATYNYTLDPGAAQSELRDKYFIHFKGNRKASLHAFVQAMRSQ